MSTETLDCRTCPDSANIALSIPDLPDEVQKSADAILSHLAGNGLRPHIQCDGHPIAIAVRLAKEFNTFTPEGLKPQGNQILDFLVQSVAQYAEETHAATLSFEFKFDRGVA